MKISSQFLTVVLLIATSHSAWGFQAEIQQPDPLSDAPDPDFSPRGNYDGPLLIPDIARYETLPMRMTLEPVIRTPDQVRRFDTQLVTLWTRILQEATDVEVLDIAAFSLSRAAELELANIEAAGPTLLAVAQSTKDTGIRYQCARALASGNIKTAAKDLITWTNEGIDSQKAVIEPALIRWKVAEAGPMWKARIADPLSKGQSFRLATEGLTALNETASVTPLLKLLMNPDEDFGKRIAAANAVAILDADQAFAAASELISGKVLNRMLAAELLDTPKPESLPVLESMTEDPSDAVASAAWLKCFQRSPGVLQDHLPAGRQHHDATVRITAARVMRLFPDEQRVEWLHTQLSDFHIEVRNVARRMLVAVATEHTELKDQIVKQASDMLKPDSDDWQGIEQSLILLGQLKATQFSPACVPLLTYPRNEVNISSAWLLQLYPDESIRDVLRTRIEHLETELANRVSTIGKPALQEAMLMQYAGIVRMAELQSVFDSCFSKACPGGIIKRASGLWALALLFEKKTDPELAAKYEGRIVDRASMPAEVKEIRLISVIALGIMRASDSTEVVSDAYRIDPPNTGIPWAARWALPLLGQPMPPEPPVGEEWISNWRLELIHDH